MNSLHIGYKKTIDRFLRSGLIGDIGHVSCMDNRRSVPHADSQDSGVDELTVRAASQLTEIAKLLILPATEVIARFKRERSGTNTHIFLSLGDKCGVHYSASNRADVDEHMLWVEGSKGSLRTNGPSIWWRKRGWPIFVPVSFPFLSGWSKTRIDEHLVSNLVAAIEKSQSQNVAVPITTQATSGAGG